MSEFARTLTRMREERRLTQMAVAQAAGVDKGYVSRLEKGTRHPRRVIVEALIDGLGLDPFEAGELLTAAGYTAISSDADILRVEPELRRALDLMADPTTPDFMRASLRSLFEMACHQAEQFLAMRRGQPV